MELRKLVDDRERQIFAECLAQARKTRGQGFRDAARSKLGCAHIAYGDLYALFENDDGPAERMVGGFIVHDLATLPQSFPKPDLSHLRPESVIEGSELWSLSTGTGRAAGLAAAAVAGLLQAKAILVYPIVKPMDLTARYSHFNFAKPCEPVLWPYVETLDGDEIWIQPMLLEGPALERYVRMGFDSLFQNSNGRRGLRIPKPVSKPEVERSPELSGPDQHKGNGVAAA